MLHFPWSPVLGSTGLGQQQTSTNLHNFSAFRDNTLYHPSCIIKQETKRKDYAVLKYAMLQRGRRVESERHEIKLSIPIPHDVRSHEQLKEFEKT
jgi:hypothetical protein